VVDFPLGQLAESGLSQLTGLPNATRLHHVIVMWFSTLDNPGAAQAANSASSRSAKERTLPCRITLSSRVSTWIFCASNLALR
jgi:hypothetical protein